MKERSQLLIVFLTVAAVLVFSSAVTFYMGHRVIVLTGSEEKYHQAVDRLDNLLSMLHDAETGQRGYLLSGDEQYLKPYDASVSQVEQQFGRLQELVAGGFLSQDKITEIQTLTDQKLAELNETIQLMRLGDHDGAMRVFKTDLGLHLMNDIRDDVSNTTGLAEQNLRASRDEVRAATTQRTIVYFVVAAINLSFLAWAYRKIKRDIDERNAAAIEIYRQKDLLAVTLASIGDAVIVTDDQSHISFMNKVAEDLTGWSQQQANGLLCEQVFRIINEDSRVNVESPVTKVLREGVIVGLANHTLLIRKDGVEFPIDDSGAPIRDSNGKVRGVVLIFRDFSLHKESERELRKAKTEVEAASRAKDQFLAALSHELRTPLTPVLATLTSWQANGELPSLLNDDIQMLRRNLELEARLIDDLLDLTRIAKGKLSLNPEVTDVNQLLDSVASIYKSEIEAKHISLKIDMGAQRHHVRADPARLQQVFWNIIKNAAKFSPEKGKISVVSENSSSSTITISISDNGIGMARETIDRLFQPFEQGDENTARQYGGLGLGMAISKALMDAQGGQIRAHSEGPGLGSTFTVELPVSEPVVAPSNTDRSNGKPSAARKLSILLVEDHDDTARVMARILQGLGHQVKIGDSVAGALGILSDYKFDLLLSDIGLPDGTGIDLMRSIRSAGNSSLRAVALTGYGMEEDISKCRQAGFDDHLTKPISFQQLEALITRLSGEKTSV